MKTYRTKLFLIIIFILAGILTAYAQQKEKSFNLGRNGKIEVKINYGEITLETWEKDQVSVKYDEGPDADLPLFKMVQNGNALTITSGDYSSEDLVITVPSSINLDLNTSGGDIKINGDITGKVQCITAGGDIKTKNINGNTELNTAGGEIRVGKVEGDAEVNSAGGDLRIGAITGTAVLNTGGGNVQVSNVRKDLKVRTGGGNVKTGDVGGVLSITTGGGNVDVQTVSSSVKVTNGGGNVTFAGAGGKTSATTGGGNLSFRNIKGGIDCYTGSGDVYVELNPDPKVDSKIQSGSGSVTLYLPENAKATVVAKVQGWDTWGEDNSRPIKSDFMITTEDKSHNTIKTTYKLNGGGSIIEVQTTSGEIYIKKQK